MHERPLSFFAAPSACNSANFDIESPSAPSVPTCKKSRRVIPSHVVIEPFPVILSIRFLEGKLRSQVTIFSADNQCRFAEMPDDGERKNLQISAQFTNFPELHLRKISGKVASMSGLKILGIVLIVLG